MKSVTLLTLAAVLLFVCGEVLAVKHQVDLSHENLDQVGFKVVMAKRDDGVMDITVTRDLSKARSFDAASNLELVRNATLEVSGPAGLIVRCRLDPESAQGAVVYRFQLAPGNLPHSRLTVSEIDDYKKNEGRPHLIGGGTFFTFQLADFVKP
jgi:hypothetical protein